MIELDGAPLTWSPNGNLLASGERALTYDHANRLTGITDKGASYGFAYNGLGDRLGQTVDGLATSYTLDLNSGLTQVLSDGPNSYLYGASRIGEEGGDGWSYHVGDALGSVRQLVDPAAEVTLAQSYEPFGSSLLTSGLGATAYGFTGGWTDGTGLVHLRARYYQPEVGRFFQPDPWSGDVYLPSSLNLYAYAYNDPILNLDPSGAMVEIPPFPNILCLLFGIGRDPETGQCPTGGGASPMLGGITQAPSITPADAAAKAIILLLGLCAFELVKLAESLHIDLSVPELGGQSSIAASRDGGAREAAQHLAMLLGRDVAGFSGHPGLPDPEGRDRRRNAQDLRNLLKEIKRNMRRGESIEGFLEREGGWSQAQIQDLISGTEEYVEFRLPTDIEFYNVSEELAEEIRALCRFLGSLHPRMG